MKSRGTPVAKIGVESAAYQKALARTTFIVGLPVSNIRPSGSKIHRMLGLSHNMEKERIRFPMQLCGGKAGLRVSRGSISPFPMGRMMINLIL
jgi:hypothetical protein